LTCPPENCTNGIDDNGDSLIDCSDPDCRNTAICLLPENCTNGIDDNGNQLIDCADPTCVDAPSCQPCNDPFADVDNDGDVDQIDFGDFQRCFTGVTIGLPTFPDGSCGCFDRNHDEMIGEADLASFINCVSGPNVPAGTGCDD
jgi:hypothetical protein